MKKIIGVIVTFNRIEKLKKALVSYENQTIKPNRLIIVDNCSNDGTVAYLKEWEKIPDTFDKTVVYLDKNTGGSGGFHTGIKKALEYDSDWLYISDDDAYLQKDVIERIQNITKNINDNFGAICGTVIENGKIGYFHRRSYKEGLFFVKENNIDKQDYKKSKIELSTYSFVGTALKTEAIWSIGLPNKDFFLWYDDTEHGVRMAKRYRIELYPELIIHHDVEISNFSVNWKKYYGYRNNLLMIKYNYGKMYLTSQIFLLKLSMIRDFLIKERRPLIKMKKTAIKDAKNNKLGLSNIYYPGSKIM